MRAIYFIVGIPMAFIVHLCLANRLRDSPRHIRVALSNIGVAWLVILFWLVPDSLLKDDPSQNDGASLCGSIGSYAIIVLIGYTVYYLWKLFTRKGTRK